MARVTGVSRNSGQANPLDQGNIEEPPLTRKNAMVSFQFSRKSNEGFGPFGFGADSLSWRSYSPWLVGPEDTTTSFVGNVGNWNSEDWRMIRPQNAPLIFEYPILHDHTCGGWSKGPCKELPFMLCFWALTEFLTLRKYTTLFRESFLKAGYYQSSLYVDNL